MSKYKFVTVERKTGKREVRVYEDKQWAINEWLLFKSKHKKYKFISNVIEIK
jgi:hypothetical protein